MWSHALGMALFMSRVVALADDIVFRTPDVVAAGSPFTVEVNFSMATWPNPQCLGPGDCDWKYFRTYLMADPTHEINSDRDPVTLWKRFCYLSGCVSTNVTSFEAMIPANSFPNGSPYTVDHILFNILPNGSESIFSPTFSGFSASIFNLTNATGDWTEFGYKMGDYGVEDALIETPCDMVPCIEECQTKWIAPYVPYVRKMGAELDACVEACLGDADPLSDCISRNETTEREEPASSATSTTTMPTGTMEPTTTSTTKPGTGSTVLPLLSWILLSAFLASMISYLD